ncbi:osmoprotectant transport system substrate-binding protein [Luteibacter sp. UNCMF331Sha3.1]|uniref:glycine betaine ABC transporter substrate-binding protein OsmF n=1 Tax=Luteibacter sp. UNCMF331Sha3.1 TaxID=1502760 RepID=UPI0008C9C599|nr:glycine betaine ABC transporter substrate-binding protein [Luteibacter sp. UNCMF331Sha3.1]SEM38439.1 osmoprotectant transport system substrate-binding protein [Luteibacter sp. UNCMF331Sha3.1]
MRRLLVVAVALIAFAAHAQAPVRVGSKADNEGALLGQVVLQVLRHAGVPVVDRTQLGPTSIVRRALLNGDLDIYPEYTGNAAFFFHRESDPGFRDAAKAYALASSLDAAANRLVWLSPAPADNHWAVGVRGDVAVRERLRSLGDFARWVNGGGDVLLAGSAEFVESDAALPAFQTAYGFTLRGDQLLVLAGGDTSATIKAAAEGISGVNASMVYSTDGAIAMTGLVVLDDPKHVEMVYQPAPVVRDDVLRRYPAIRPSLAAAFRPLTLDVLRRLNARTQIEGEDPAAVAADYLRHQGLVP